MMASVAFQSPVLVIIFLVQWISASETVYTVQNKESGKVLEGTTYLVGIKDRNDTNKNQLWRVEPASLGRHVLINVGYNKALDSEKASKESTRAILWNTHRRENQRFYINVDGTIVVDQNHGQKHLALTVKGDRAMFVPSKREADQIFTLIPVEI